MASPSPSFAALPAEYQALIRQAEQQHSITITLLQALGGGWSGARLFLVSVAARTGNDHPQHLILKLDHKNERVREDELTRYNQVLARSPADFAAQHLPRVPYDRVEQGSLVAIFYAIAGHSLHRFRPLGRFEQQREIETLFGETYRQYLEHWNSAPNFGQLLTPVEVLAAWLEFRLKPGNHIERFLRETLHIAADLPGFLVDGKVLPNPLAYAQHPEWWGGARPLDVPLGMMHGDLNTGNILAQLSPNGEAVDGFYLIDFALFKEQRPLLYDLRYVEMSYLILRQGHASPAALTDLITATGDPRSPTPHKVASTLSGLYAVLSVARRTFDQWVMAQHPSLADDLWGLYWLAGVAAGLAYCHKPGLGDNERILGLLYGAANLKHYLSHFGLPLPTEARALASALAAPGQLTAAVAPPATPNNLPANPTPLIGREAEITALRARLTDPAVRLVTLTGPGGTGKTRLSLQVAAEVLPEFRDGVYFVPLADVRDAARVLPEIARVLGLREGGNLPVAEAIATHLRDQGPLLVLDNFEQVVEAAEALAKLLAAVPRLKLLVTSRIALRLRGEYEFPVPPLSLPAEDQAIDVNQTRQTEAVRLFETRAVAALPSFAVTLENAADVAAICRRLDGLPLALELAAARIKLLPPAALLQRLGQGLALLSGGARDLPARHRALRATLDWSYDLLSPEEQTLLARLGVFVGGFSLEAAEAICNPEGRLDVLANLATLVDNSLVEPSAAGGQQPRYRLLETIREYAIERLNASGEAEALRRAHARYFIKVTNITVGLNLYMAEASHYLDLIETEYENVRATLEWCLAHVEARDELPFLVMSLNWFWYRRAYLAEGRKLSQRVLQALPPRSLARAVTLTNLGMLTMWQGELTAALAAASEGLDLLLALEDEYWLPPTLMARGIMLINMGRDAEAHPALVSANAAFKAAGMAVFDSISAIHLGNVALGLGRPAEAVGHLQAGLALARTVGETWTISFALNNLGEVARVRGDYTAAREFYAQSEALLRESGDHGDLARLIHNLGYTDIHLGDLAGAESRFAESLTIFRRVGNKRGLAECLAAFATVRAMQGRGERAATLLGSAENMLIAWGAAWWPADRGEIDRTRARLLAALGEEAYTAAHAAGKTLGQEEALKLAQA